MVVGYTINHIHDFFQYFLKLISIFYNFFKRAGALELGSQRDFSVKGLLNFYRRRKNTIYRNAATIKTWLQKLLLLAISLLSCHHLSPSNSCVLPNIELVDNSIHQDCNRQLLAHIVEQSGISLLPRTPCNEYDESIKQSLVFLVEGLQNIEPPILKCVSWFRYRPSIPAARNQRYQVSLA